MSHVRQQIREAAATLVTGLTTTSTRVFQSRVYNVQESELPCLLIYTKDESVSSEEGTLKAYLRTVTLTIEGKAQAKTGLDDTLDDIAKEVEIAMSVASIGSKTILHYLTDSNIEYSGDGDQPIGSVSLNYSVQYMTPYGNPETVV